MTGCDPTGLCCVITSFAINSDGYSLKVFNLSLAALTLISSVYLLVRLMAARMHHIPLHFNFVVVSCVTLVLVTITGLIPFPSSYGGTVAHDVIHCAALVAQWYRPPQTARLLAGGEQGAKGFGTYSVREGARMGDDRFVQIAVTLFMFGRTSAFRRSVVVAALVALVFGAAWSVSAYVAGCPCQGEMAIEVPHPLKICTVVLFLCLFVRFSAPGVDV